jgi:hypothetical protein
MAISRNMLMQNLSGHIGRQLVFKQYGDKTVVSKFPNMEKRKLTDKQLLNQVIMKKANYNAKRILANDELRREAQVRLNVTRNKLYHALVREYFVAAKENEAED